MATGRIEMTSRFAEAPDQVYAYFSDVRAHFRVLPWFVRAEFLSDAYPELYAGQLLDYRIRLFGFWFCWRTRIDQAVTGGHFTDSQAFGPFRRFVHMHEFLATESGGTVMIDRVWFESGYGRLVDRFLVGPVLERIFQHRRRLTEKPGALR